jgi:hypothetical protein
MKDKINKEFGSCKVVRISSPQFTEVLEIDSVLHLLNAALGCLYNSHSLPLQNSEVLHGGVDYLAADA